MVSVLWRTKSWSLRKSRPHHTLCWASYTLFEYIDPAEVGADISLAEVELRKPRNLFVCVSEEREDGERGEREGEGTQALSLSSGTHKIQNSFELMNCCLLWIVKARAKDKTYMWVLFIITEKARAKERKWDGVGVMKDKELKLEDVKAQSHTMLSIIHTIWIHRSRRSRSRHQHCGGRVAETEESICMCERGAWGRGAGGKGGRGHTGTISVVRYT